MSYIFTITNANPYVFTATVVNSNLAVSVSTASVTASVINPGFTATLFTNVVSVDTNNDQVNVTSPIANFTGTIIDQTVTVTSPYGNVDVTVAPVTNTVTVDSSDSPVSIEYNPTIIRHLYDGQPVYTTSSVQFAGLTLGTTSTYTFPPTDGEYGQFLATDGNGFLYWSTSTGGGGDIWSLTTDLLTNGFNIKSGGGLVPLTLNAGGSQLDLGVNSTKLYQTGTNRSIEINALSSNIDIKNANSEVKLTPERVEVTGDLLVRDYLLATDIQTTRIYATGAAIDVPSLRFPDGSVQSSAQTGIFTTTGIISLTADLYTNAYAIRGNVANGTLTLTQGITTATFVGNGTTEDFYRLYRRNTTVGQTDEFRLDRSGLAMRLGSDAGLIHLARDENETQALIKGNRFNVEATTASFVTTNPVSFSSGIKFADGSVQTTAGGAGNAGVNSITSLNSSLVLSASTGNITIDLVNLPLISDDFIDVTPLGNPARSSQLNLRVNDLFNKILPGTGTTISRNTATESITISSVPTFASTMTSDLHTAGYNIDAGYGEQLYIRGGESDFLGNQTYSQIYFPVNQPLNLYSSYGITLDTPDDKTVTIASPFTVTHRDGASRISTNAVGETRLNDGTIAVTATNRVILQNSIITPTRVQIKATSAGVVGVTVTATGVTLAGDIKLASTNRVQVGQDLYNSKLGVQDLTNYNGTGPVVVTKGIQFADLTVQRTAYQGYLNFGQIAAPATNPQDFFLQLQPVDFGTVDNPGTLAYDAGTI